MKINKKIKVIIISILSFLILLSCAAGIFLYGIFFRTTNSTVFNNATREEKWQSDLEFVKKELPKKHENLFFSKSEKDFNREMDLLMSNINKLNDLELKAELAKIINSVNDSHTAVDIEGTLFYPLGFFEFEEGIYLSNTIEEYKDLWGKKLISINGYSIKELREMLKPYISQDNQAIARNQFCSSLTSLETLRMVGIIKDNDAVFTFKNGTQTEILIKPLGQDQYFSVKSLTDLPEYISKFPVNRQKINENYWFQYMEDKKTVYVKYNSCSNTTGYSFKDFTKDVFDELDSKKAQRLVIDFRDNGGGNSAVFSPIIKAIKKHESINNKDSLFVIVGRKTFSSAILNAMDLRNGTEATLIGEPTGGKPNHFGEVKKLHLSNVNIDIYYSSNYFKTTNEETDSVYPDVTVGTMAESYFNGKDDFVEYIFSGF